MAPARLASEVEARGFQRLFVSEHTHIPAVERPALPDGRDLPDDYKYCCDPFVWLACAAEATTSLRIGTGVCLVAQHDPILLAKTVATLDHLSGGRVDLGIGYGYNLVEAANHGVAKADRRPRLREHVLAIRELWEHDVGTFAGEFVQITPSWSWPKPAQHPHPPLLMGAAAGRGTFGHIVEFCDGWMMHGKIEPADLAQLRSEWEAAGRDFDDFTLGIHRVQPSPATLEAFVDLEADFVTLTVLPQDDDEVLRQLDELAVAATDYLT